MNIRQALLGVFAWLLADLGSFGQIYVSPAGNDRNPGTPGSPVATFAGAVRLVRDQPPTEPLEVIFREGVYYLPEPVVFEPEDGRSSGAPVVYRAEKPGSVVISGGRLLPLKWKPFRNGIYEARVEGDPEIDQLYINGRRQRMARFPNAEEGKNVFDKWNLSKGEEWNNYVQAENPSLTDPLNPHRIARWKNPEGGFIHAMHAYLWGDMHWVITGKENDTLLRYEGGWQNNRPSPMHPQLRIVENIFEELDSPGEWYYSRREGRLFFLPDTLTDLQNARVEIVRLKNLVTFAGTREYPVRNIRLQGFIFRHTARTFMENREPQGRSDWTLYRGGAVLFNGAEDCSLSGCEFDQVGGNTVMVNNYNRRIRISECHIHDSGANGVVFTGDPESVRSYRVGYVPQDYAALDTVPGPATDNYPADCVVENCLIVKTGRDEKQTAAVQISKSRGIRVSHCSIYDLPRAGINISEGAFGGHVVEYCDVFNTVLETGDHGSFNSWGRDRYWTPDPRETARQVAKRPSMPYWDVPEPIIIRNSRWFCEYGWDIDLDDGSSHYRIYNNLLLNRGLKLREGYDRIVINNILINNGLHPHVWYPGSGDVFRGNILFMAYQPAVMNAAMGEGDHWGRELDFNFYAAAPDVMRKFAANGCDRNSLHGDPLFLDAAGGDFRVRDDSPALKIGFVNFPMDSFGVMTPWLKALARTPPVPAIIIRTGSGSLSEETAAWCGAGLREPRGDELSAFGVGFDDGGVAMIRVPEQSVAAGLGFRQGDLIREVGGIRVKTIRELRAAFESLAAKPWLEIILVRNQARASLKLKPPYPKVSRD